MRTVAAPLESLKWGPCDRSAGARPPLAAAVRLVATSLKSLKWGPTDRSMGARPLVAPLAPLAALASAVLAPEAELGQVVALAPLIP